MSQRADKRREWSERLGRFARSSGATVAAFCRAERVSEPSFYQWRRKLAARGANRAVQERRSTREAPQTFVPVQLIPAAALVEIRLPNGARVRLPSDDRQLLAAAIAAAGQLPPAGHNPGTPEVAVPLHVEDAAC